MPFYILPFSAMMLAILNCGLNGFVVHFVFWFAAMSYADALAAMRNFTLSCAHVPYHKEGHAPFPKDLNSDAQLSLRNKLVKWGSTGRTKMNRSISIAAWAGQLSMFLMFMAMWPAWHILPPPSPNLPLEQWADHLHGNPTPVYFGAILMMFASSLFFVFFGGLVACLKKMEGKSTPLTHAVVMIVPFGFFPLFAMSVFFVEAAFRPGMSAETIGMLTDLGIFMLVIPALPGLVQFVVTGIIILKDVNVQPIFPRWVGYFSIWVGVLSVAGCVVPFFKSGPFAWNGIFTFWLPAVIFGILINVLFWAMRRAARHPAMQA
jgi:hypothetical protein